MLSEYKGANEDLTLKCTIHNYIYSHKAGLALKGNRGCIFCYNQKSLNPTERESWISKKREILEEKLKISDGDLFVFILLCGEESMDLSTIEKIKSYYKTLGGEEESKIFDKFVKKDGKDVDGHRFDKIDLTKAQLSTEDLMSIVKYDVVQFWNFYKNENDKLEKRISELVNETGGEYFSKWKDIVLDEFNKLKEFKIPEDYIGWELTTFQKLSALQFLDYQHYGIWSDTGLGKTVSYIVGSMYIKSKLTVIFCPNTTSGKSKEDIDSVRKTIETCDKNHHIYFKNQLKDDIVLDTNKNNYVIFNYEQGQLPTSDKYFEWFASKFNVDMLIFDEIQNLKVISNKRNKKNELINSGIRYKNIKNFRIQLEEKNPNIKVVASTATVYVNTPAETISMIEMLTGKNYNDIPNKNSFKVGARLSLEIFKMGLRETKNTGEPNYIEIKINGDDIKEELNKPGITPMMYHYLTINHKIKNSPITKGAIIYTKFLSKGILKGIKVALKKYHPELSVCEFTGQNVDDRYLFFKEWQEKKYDVIIGSDAIIAGIDGFQKRNDSYFVWIDFVWTDKDRQQLAGRINFRGMDGYGRRADIYIPQIYIDGYDIDGNSIHWSYDEYKKSRVENKHSMSDLIMNRTFDVKREERKTFEDSMELLRKIDLTYEEKERDRLNAPPINIDAKRPKSIPRHIVTGDITGNVHFQTSKINPENIKNVHISKEFHAEYIKDLTSKRRNIDHIKWIISQIDDENGIVGDIGCGDNIIKNMIKNKVYSFDLYAHSPDVIECNIIDLPIPDNSLDYGIYSLSIEQSRGEYKYIEEAYRVINPGGKIIIVTNKPSKRFIDALKDNDFSNIDVDFSDNGVLKYITAIKN